MHNAVSADFSLLSQQLMEKDHIIYDSMLTQRMDLSCTGSQSLTTGYVNTEASSSQNAYNQKAAKGHNRKHSFWQ